MSRLPLNLSRRERELIETLYRLEEGSVSQVRESLEDPPGYSSVRALLNGMVRKEQLTVRQEGKRYIYRPAQARAGVAKRILSNLVKNSFQGKPSQAICALLDETNLSNDEIERIKQQIAQSEETK